MRRASSLLLVALLAPLAYAAPPLHEDFDRAADDYAVLRILAGTVLAKATGSLNASLVVDETRAIAGGAEALSLADGMRDVVALDAPSATSRDLIVPLATAAVALTANTTPLAEEWIELQALNATRVTTRAELAAARILAALVREHATNALANADEYESLEYDVAWLRAALEAMLAGLRDIEIVLDEAEATLPDPTPFLLIQVVPNEVPLTKPLAIRGVLSAPRAGGASVAISVDGALWQNATTRADGFFSAIAALPEGLLLGTHVATATAVGLRSNDATFTVIRVPTRLTLALPASAFPENATLNFTAKLAEVGGKGFAAVVALAIDGDQVATLVAGDDGRGAIGVSARGLAPGSHVARATFAGDETRAPSEATISFDLVLARVDPRRESVVAPISLLALLLALLAAQSIALEATRSRRAPFFAIVAGAPIVAAIVGWRVANQAVLALSLSSVVSLAFVVRRRAVERRARGEGLDAATRAPLPPALAAAVEARVGAFEAVVDDARSGLVALYRQVLVRLAMEGLDVRALTHREIAREMRARGYAEEPVAELTRAVELALYAGAPADVERARDAVRLLGVSA